MTETGDHIGKITDILETGSNDVYVVSDSKKSELLIPATSEFVLEIKIDLDVKVKIYLNYYLYLPI